MEIPGLDTIMGLVGKPPMEVRLPHSVVHHEELLRQVWNAKYIAIILYCYSCKEPLTWHSPPDDDGTLFHCPKCGRKWLKDDSWKTGGLKSNDQPTKM